MYSVFLLVSEEYGQSLLGGMHMAKVTGQHIKIAITYT